MRTRLGIFCDKMIEAGWLAAVIVVPLFFNIYSQRVFEPDKLSLLRSIALVMSVAWVIRIVEDRRANSGQEEQGEQHVFLLQRVYKAPLVLPTLLLVLVYLVSTMASIAPSVSFWGSYQRLQGTYTTLSYIVIFFLALQGIRTKRQLNRLISAMVLVSFPIAMYGLIQHFGLDPLPWGGNVTTRVAANMGNPIFVAAFLILVVPLTLSRLFENWKQAVGPLDTRDGVLGVIAFVLLAGALLASMLWRKGEGTVWISWVALLFGVGLQVPIYLLSPAERRPRVLAISLPLTFAFLVGFSWILEIFFPPGGANYFWLGLLASLIFVLAMWAFAYYLRKPVSRLLLVAAYFVILIAQLVCIFYTQSRGPLLGLLGGLFFYFALLGLLKRQTWLPWLMSVAAAVVVIFLVMFNTVEAPLMDTLRDVPYVGRLGKVLQTDRGTGKVRILIWEGVVDMIDWHDPLEKPGEEGGPDPLNILRPIIGYGPESMYVAYSRFYPPDLAHFERRNASPDRSHNETFDALVITGAVGFAIYMLVFTSVFYYGLKWLGLIRDRWQKLAFLGLWIGGGIIGALGTWAWRGPLYVGLGIPLGTIGGLAVYVFVVVLTATFRPAMVQLLGGGYSLWVLTLVSAIVAHYIEIHFGIAIAATRTYFWIYAAMMVVIGTRLTAQPDVAKAEVPKAPAFAESREPAPHRRRGRSRSGERAAADPQPEPRNLGDQDWLGELMVVSLMAVLILCTMMFDYITVQPGDPGLLPTIWRSLTVSQGASSPVILALFLVTWGMIGLVGLSDLATREESKGKGPMEWLAAAATFALVCFGALVVFALLHAVRLRPITITSPDVPNPLTNTITFYYLFVFLTVVALALVLTFLFRRPTKAWRWTGEIADIAVIAVAVILPLMAGILIFTSNISMIRADILYKQGLSSEKAQHWDGAIFFYEQATDMAPDQDFYYLFLGRAYMEKGKGTSGQEREYWLEQSEKALQKAREIAPLNTDHSANLARLYRSWGGLSQGQQRTERLVEALDYYADATSLSPNNAQLFNEWGQTYYILGDDDQALETYQDSVSLDSEYFETYLLLGEFYTQQREWDKAVESYQRAVEIKPKRVDGYSALGYVHSQLGNMESALQAYQKAVELRPMSFNDRKNLAILYQQMGRVEDAISEGTLALELAPADQKPAVEAFLAQLGAVQAGASTEDAQEIQRLIAQGNTEMNAEDWAAAEETFKQILELEPDNPHGHSALAYVYARLGRVDEAIAENLTVVKLMPDDYNSHKNLALLYQQEGEFENAIAAAEVALGLAPEDERQALQIFVEQLRQLQGASPAPAESGVRAGDLPPEERVYMYNAPPPMVIDPDKTYHATIVTEQGDILVELYADRTPGTVNNFVFLARDGFYDNTTFHRVIPGFMAQGGDPGGTGSGGPGYAFADEFDPALRHDRPGVLSMANAGPNTNGSQFFITYDATPWLDDRHAVFGEVLEGIDVLEALTPRDPQQNPSFPGDKIRTIVIKEE
jgi:cyclophilin family peptidyl-prolyl cis-trans isomerase/tetratricopeptide (TPR) repeat protein